MGHSTLRLLIVGYGAVTAAGSAVVAFLAPSMVPAVGLAVSAGVHPALTMAQLRPSTSTNRRLCTPWAIRRCPCGVRQAPPRVGTRAQAGTPQRATSRRMFEPLSLGRCSMDKLRHRR